MVTKTITITEDAYKLLAENKYNNESFSKVIRRTFTQQNKKTIKDFLGLLSNEEGERIIKNLDKRREINLKLKRERLV